MKKLTVYMQERVFYIIDQLEVPDDATEDDIEALAEQAFAQGDYREAGQDDRHVASWEERT